MTENIKNNTEFIFVKQLQDSCTLIRNFYLKAASRASAHALKHQMQALAKVLYRACESITPFEKNRIATNKQQNQQLLKIEHWYQSSASRLPTLPTTQWVMESNKYHRQFIALLRALIAPQQDKLLRYVLSDMTAQLQLGHDQLIDRLNRQEHLMLDES